MMVGATVCIDPCQTRDARTMGEAPRANRPLQLTGSAPACGRTTGTKTMSTDVFDAIRRHDVARLAELLEAGADPNARQEKWPHFTALLEAIDSLDNGGSLDVVMMLLLRGADANACDAKNETTPLLMAIVRGRHEAARLLLVAGANPNVRGDEGDSPLRWAVSCGDVAMATTLLRLGAVSTIDDYGGPPAGSGRTALGIAAGRLDVPMIALLLDAGADPSRGGDTDYSALRYVQSAEGSDAARSAAAALLSTALEKAGPRGDSRTTPREA